MELTDIDISQNFAEISIGQINPINASLVAHKQYQL